MRRWICLGVWLAAASTAAAPAKDRCTAGARYEDQGDLPRAALYLDGCDEVDGFERATRDLKKKLEASQLSKLDIVSTPAGLVVEVDALPGEPVTTPATVWVRAGRHVVKGEQITGAVDVPPHAHATIVLEPKKPPPPPRSGHVSFDEENAGNVTSSDKLPDVQHRPMLDCKYTKSCAAQGAQLDDPLALHEAPPPAHPRWSATLVGGATAYDSSLAPTIAGRVRLRLQGADTPLPWIVEFVESYSHSHDINDLAGGIVLAKVIAAPDTAWLSAGVGVGYSMLYSLQGYALVDLDLRRLPLAIDACYRQGSMNEHVVTLGIGYRLDLGL